MDIYKLIRELYAEKEELDRAIAALEELENRGDSSPQPGVRKTLRKKMDES
jgi:hypothetical protein